MHSNQPLDFAPDSPEEAVMHLAMQIGRRMKLRQPGDEVDAATIPLLHVLTCSGDIRLSDLAQLMHLDASTVSRHARQLEERGLIARTDDPDDRRASRIAITDLGTKALGSFVGQRKRQLAQVLSAWSGEDRACLHRLASRFVTDLNAGGDPAAN